ncbi:MAG: hypothetical protein CL608_10230 [Anaerolineaceae bacterium]|nr:hypothetical protein [Anaerolineaceae bacterium]
MTPLQHAAKAIRAGDKSLGKKLLVELLNEDPTNDMAWVWMSTVVGTDKMRRECLEEALRHNPHNQTAQKGLKKLQQSSQAPTFPSAGHSEQITPTVTELSQQITPQAEPVTFAQAPAMSKDSQATVEYLCKRMMLEKGHVILAPHDDPVPLINPDNFLFPILTGEIPELLPLQSYFDIVLFRQTAPRFDFICLKVCRRKNDLPTISQAELIEIGQACLKYSNVVMYGQVMPVIVQVWEIFERQFSPEDENRLKGLKRLPGTKSVGIFAYASDEFSREIVFSSGWPHLSGYRRRFQRLLNEENSFSEEKTLQAIANRRLEVMPILAGIVLGVALGLGLRIGASSLGWRYDLVFDSFISILISSVAVYLPEFKFYSRWQGVLTAFGFGIVLYGILLVFLNYEPSFWYAISLLFIVGWGRFIGIYVEP